MVCKVRSNGLHRQNLWSVRYGAMDSTKSISIFHIIILKHFELFWIPFCSISARSASNSCFMFFFIYYPHFPQQDWPFGHKAPSKWGRDVVIPRSSRVRQGHQEQGKSIRKSDFCMFFEACERSNLHISVHLVGFGIARALLLKKGKSLIIR